MFHKICLSKNFFLQKQAKIIGSIFANMKQEMGSSFYFRGVSASNAILVVEKEGTPIWNEFEWDCV